MLSHNQFAGSFDHQYLWKQLLNVLDFLQSGSLQGRGNFIFSWIWSDMANQAQTYQHLPEVFFGNPKGIMKDWLIYNGIGKIFLPQCIWQKLMFQAKILLFHLSADS